ncbi:solute carrier family 22 member 6-like isoform X2 [Scylla paramamosain]|uniref:solute carrier family 22 member 6-like isoform X2 n=1 Tax=Scylla paramamosain TaxID=85552 RepID=UPI003083343F
MSSPGSPPPQTFDELLTLMGTGRWNFLYITTLILRLSIQPSHALSGVYLAPWQAHTCRPHPSHLNLTRSRDACHYVIERPATGGELNETEELEVPCTQWDYDFSTFTSSLTSDYDLVCHQDHLRALYQSLYMMGTTVSPVLCGYLADRFGRMKVLMASQITLSVSSIVICFLYNLPLIFMLRFILGFSEILTGFVLTLEVCEPKHRVAVGILSGLGWSLGTMIWGGLAYLLRAWRSLQLASSLPTLIAFPLLLNKDITVITLVIALCYFCVALVYDGLNLAGDLYSDNLYLYLVLGGLAEIPGIVLAAPLVHRLGRKAPIVACLLGCGVVNIAISFLQAETRAASFTAAMLGKLLVTAAFQIIYLYSSELFPTEVRTSGVDGASAVGQVGAVLAPYFSSYLGPLVSLAPVLCVRGHKLRDGTHHHVPA